MRDRLARDEDDHDLLTFNESGIRLREEIALIEAALREDPPAERRAVLQTRLAALTDALERNTRQADANPGETGFLELRSPWPARAAAGEGGHDERAQRRGRAIAMTAAEVDEFLAAERTCRVATAGRTGAARGAAVVRLGRGALWLSRWCAASGGPT